MKNYRMKNTVALFFVLLTLTFVQGYSYIYLGCFKDKKKPNRALPKFIKNHFTNSPKLCATQCAHDGYKYFGLQQGFMCWCGSSGYDKYGLSNSCWYPCTGDFTLNCGGGEDNSVYEVVYTATTQATTEPLKTTRNTKTIKSYNLSAATTNNDERRTLQQRDKLESNAQMGGATTGPLLCAIIIPIAILVVLLVIYKNLRASRRSNANELPAEPMLNNGQGSVLNARNFARAGATPNIYTESPEVECVNVLLQTSNGMQVTFTSSADDKSDNGESVDNPV